MGRVNNGGWQLASFDAIAEPTTPERPDASRRPASRDANCHLCYAPPLLMKCPFETPGRLKTTGLKRSGGSRERPKSGRRAAQQELNVQVWTRLGATGEEFREEAGCEGSEAVPLESVRNKFRRDNSPRWRRCSPDSTEFGTNIPPPNFGWVASRGIHDVPILGCVPACSSSGCL